MIPKVFIDPITTDVGPLVAAISSLVEILKCSSLFARYFNFLRLPSFDFKQIFVEDGLFFNLSLTVLSNLTV